MKQLTLKGGEKVERENPSENLFLSVGNNCLEKASEILIKETVLSDEKLNTVKSLIDIAISVDANLRHWYLAELIKIIPMSNKNRP